MSWVKVTNMQTGATEFDSHDDYLKDVLQKKENEVSNISSQLSPETIQRVIIQGDLSTLSPANKLDYYSKVVQSLGLNGLTKPFAFIKLNGKEVLYATRDCTDQLRRIHKISIKITAREHINGVYVVTAQASTPDGRVDESTGAVATEKLTGDNLANAYLKCETKSKRRVTLSICGLGLLDETEVETIKDATPVQQPMINEYHPYQRGHTPGDGRSTLGPQGAPLDEPGEYEVAFGKKYKGKKIKDIETGELGAFIEWCEAQASQQGKPMSYEARQLKINFDAFIEQAVDLASKEEF